MKEPDEIIEAGRYPDLETASDRALVVLALGCAYWLFEAEDGFVLDIDARDEPHLRSELEAFEREERERKRETAPVEPVSPISLFMFAWFLTGAFLIESDDPETWIALGASSRAGVQGAGEWWRTLTALTLHGDPLHLVTNIVFGVVFAFGLLPVLGTGLTWLSVILAGAAGNWINSALQPAAGFQSIGASTGVFGAIGVSVACRISTWIRERRSQTLREILFSLGAGCALLAILGTGSETDPGMRTDYMAHLWGFLSGLMIGPMAFGLAVRWKRNKRLQIGTLSLALGALAWAWWQALR